MHACGDPDSDSAPVMLSVSDLAFCRGGEAVFSEVSFEADAGQVLQIDGPNGSGKTTLLRVLAGLLRPAAGTIRWRGADTRKRAADWRRSLAYVGHANAVSRDLTVVENLRFAARLGAAADCDTTDAHSEHRALSRLGLAACQHRLAGALSQGSSGASRSRACCWSTSRSGCSTNPPPRSMPNRRGSSRRASRNMSSAAGSR